MSKISIIVGLQNAEACLNKIKRLILRKWMCLVLFLVWLILMSLSPGYAWFGELSHGKLPNLKDWKMLTHLKYFEITKKKRSSSPRLRFQTAPTRNFSCGATALSEVLRVHPQAPQLWIHQMLHLNLPKISMSLHDQLLRDNGWKF